jgi:uncharacterized coiled-coil DUF342 family protein
MNRGIINEAMLERDIENIEFYLNEENKILNKIYDAYQEALDCYSSTNTNFLSNHLNTLPKNISDIWNKRKQYTNTLQRVIQQYHMLSESTRKKFEDGDGML